MFLFLMLDLPQAATAQLRRDPGDFYEEGRQQLEREIERMNQKREDNPLTIQSEWLNWQAVTWRDGGFKVLMPGSPKDLRDVLETATGTIPVKGLVVERDASRFIVSYSDQGAVPLGKEQATLASVGDRLLARVQGQEIGDRGIFLEAYPGRELKVQQSGGILTLRLYLVAQRLYILGVSEPQDKDSAAEITKFFSSFQLLPAEVTSH